MAALTDTGITIDSLDTILGDVEADQLANISAKLNINPDDVLGQLNGIFAAQQARAHELIEEVYQSAYPDTATGQSLSYIAALTGTIRRQATKAFLPGAVLYGTPGSVVPAGTQLYPDGDPDSLFETLTEVTIVEHGALDYEFVDMQAVTEGSGTTAAVGDSMTVATPVSGLSYGGVAAYAPGLDEETDAELRFRREQQLAQAGNSTVDAIRANMLNVTGVDSCTVFENVTGQVDVNGVPPNAIEVLVFSEGAPPYTGQDVADAIFASKPAGTEAHGAIGPITVVDSAGNSHEVHYSEPTTVRVWVSVLVTTTNDGAYLGDAGVAEEIVKWAINTLRVGQNIYVSDIINIVADLQGVESVDITGTYVGESAIPLARTVIVTDRELATIALADVGVTSV